jgi:hypothetical protein
MTSEEVRRERYTLPGNGLTDEDLRHEVELTREELGTTVARLLYKVDVPARTRDAMHTRLNQAKVTAGQARQHPFAVCAILAALGALVTLWIWARR